MPASTQIDKKNQGRVFEVIKGQVGAWPEKSAFSEYEFRRIHPAPKPGNPEDAAVSVDDYYESAFRRLLDGEGEFHPPSIRVVADRKPDPTPLGPEANPPKPAPINPMVVEVARAMQAIGEQQNAAK